RFLLLLPHADGRALLGLTDVPQDGPVPPVPDVPQSDVDFLLEASQHLLGVALGRQHVRGSFAGLRPLLDQPGRKRSADLSRRHSVIRSANNVITVVGGKLTTYRKMAADAVDAAIQDRGLAAGPARPPSVPRRPLRGAAPGRPRVRGSFAGLRPLLAQPGRKRSADLSRRHSVIRSANNVIAVVGGKLTTYRKMAADAVDAAIQAP